MKHDDSSEFVPPCSPECEPSIVEESAQTGAPAEEEAFYDAQAEAFSDLDAYHTTRPRRPR